MFFFYVFSLAKMSAHQQGVIFNSTLSVSAARMAQAASWLMITTCPPLITGSKWFLKKKYHFYKEVFVSFHGEEIQRVQYVTTLMMPLLCIPAKACLSYKQANPVLLDFTSFPCLWQGLSTAQGVLSKSCTAPQCCAYVLGKSSGNLHVF